MSRDLTAGGAFTLGSVGIALVAGFAGGAITGGVILVFAALAADSSTGGGSARFSRTAGGREDLRALNRADDELAVFAELSPSKLRLVTDRDLAALAFS